MGALILLLLLHVAVVDEAFDDVGVVTVVTGIAGVGNVVLLLAHMCLGR